MSATFNEWLSTPIGCLNVVANDAAITTIDFTVKPGTSQQPSAITNQACRELQEYFAGQRRRFEISLQPHGTRFQQQVWQALLHVAYGVTCSYSDIASVLSNPKAVRAVGAANGRNPIPIMIPCHRIIGKSGTLTGYAGGLQVKHWLLQHEGVLLA